MQSLIIQVLLISYVAERVCTIPFFIYTVCWLDLLSIRNLTQSGYIGRHAGCMRHAAFVTFVSNYLRIACEFLQLETNYQRLRICENYLDNVTVRHYVR
jgi:hypothetical protein